MREFKPRIGGKQFKKDCRNN